MRKSRKSASDFRFGTKAETLARLEDHLRASKIPKFFYFDVKEWISAGQSILNRIDEAKFSGLIIVRSSAQSEDTQGSSMAGAFISVPNLVPQDKRAISHAIGTVLNSFAQESGSENPDDQVIIQEMVRDVSMSGVLLTQDLNTGAPYFTINYDDFSGDTSAVTSGGLSRTLLVERGSEEQVSSTRFRALLKAANEIEEVVDLDTLDIEFAVDKADNVSLLQVRKITTAKNWNRGLSVRIADQLNSVEQFLKERVKPEVGVVGGNNIFGKMPDWNPAEMIGSTPKPLALSLYRRLITDKAWRVARGKMGYRNPAGSELMIALAGQPFIDVRLSLNSFLPADLDINIGASLVNHWLQMLIDNPQFHDKLEFNVATTAYCFDSREKIEERYDQVLNLEDRQRFASVLRRQTEKFLRGSVAPIPEQLEKIEWLADRRERLLNNPKSISLTTVAALLEQCIQFGTIPFAVLARHAFIANELLNSMVSIELIDSDDKAGFLSGIKTVAGEFVDDLQRLAETSISQESFNQRYGHLRPGTYDILSVRYDRRESIELNRPSPGSPLQSSSIIFSSAKLKHLQKALIENQIEVRAEECLRYITDSIKGREYAKFIFSRNLSDALEILSAWGEERGLSREELAYIEIDRILDTQVRVSGASIEEFLREEAERGKDDHEITEAIRFPHLIHNLSDIRVIPLRVDQPNFITRKVASGPVVCIDGSTEDLSVIDGGIVLIESADPGFDWIFARPLIGLVTKFGGVNSHMAIRCAEFGLPAAIGCGEQIFCRLQQYKMMILNCAEERVLEKKL